MKAQGKNRKSGRADQTLAYIQQLYGLEKELRRSEALPEKVLALRHEQAQPILEQFRQWLLKRSTQALLPWNVDRRKMLQGVDWEIKRFN